MIVIVRSTVHTVALVAMSKVRSTWDTEPLVLLLAAEAPPRTVRTERGKPSHRRNSEEIS